MTGAVELCIVDGMFASAHIRDVYAALSEVRIMAGALYVGASDLEAPEDLAARLAPVLPDATARLLVTHCRALHAHLRGLGYDGIDGFEIWTNPTPQSSAVVLHIDNDERLRFETGRIRCPRVGTISYIGPAEALNGGGTLFCLDDALLATHRHLFFERRDWPEVAAAAGADGVLVPFRPGRTVFFRGDLPHCVTPFARPTGGPRLSLLVNAWSSRIESVPPKQLWSHP